MLKGSRQAILKRIQPISIHGQASWEIVFTHVDDTGYRRDLDRFVSTVRAKLSTVSNAVEAESFARFRPQHAMVGPLDSVRPFGEVPVNPAGPT